MKEDSLYGEGGRERRFVWPTPPVIFIRECAEIEGAEENIQTHMTRRVWSLRGRNRGVKRDKGKASA